MMSPDPYPGDDLDRQDDDTPADDGPVPTDPTLDVEPDASGPGEDWPVDETGVE